MKKSIGLFIVTILSMLLGFIRESVVAYKLGASWEADVFVFAISLPTVIFSAIGGVLYTTILPLYTEARIKYGNDVANSFAGYAMKVVGLISSIFVVIGCIFPNYIINIFAPGIADTSLIDLPLIIRLVLPSLLFLGLAYIFNGILNSFGDVIITSSIEIPMHLTIILFLLLIYDKFGLIITILSVLLGSILKFIFTYFNARKWGYSYNSSCDLGKQYFNKMIKLIIPMFVSCMYLSIIQMFSISIASKLGEGNIMIYNLSNKLYNVCYSTAGNLIVIIVFPILAEYVAKRDYENLSYTISKSLNLSFLIMVPISIFIFILSNEVVEVLFGYGRFNADEINRTSDMVKYFSIGLPFLGLKEILNRVFYSFKDRKISLINTLLSLTVFIVSSSILIPIFGIKALAISMTLSIIISVILLFKSLNRINIIVDYLYMKKNFITIILSSIIFMIILKIWKLIFLAYEIESKIILLINLALIGLAAFLIYIFILYLLKNEQIIYFKDLILKKIRQFFK